MTISKQLKQHLDNKVGLLIKIFKKEFLLIKKRFDDDRAVEFLDLKDSGSNKFFFGEDKERDDEYSSIYLKEKDTISGVVAVLGEERKDLIEFIDLLRF